MTTRPTRTDPAWLACLLQLSIDTRVDQFAFADWLHQHRFKLRDEFYQSDEPDYNAVEDTLGIWLRERFLAERALNSRPARVPTITGIDCPRNGSGSAGSLVDFAYEQARRKLL